MIHVPSRKFLLISNIQNPIAFVSQAFHSCWWCSAFEIGTYRFRNREASWFFSDPPDKARDSALKLEDFFLQHAGVHPIPGRI
jgi:hypothetical protein